MGEFEQVKPYTQVELDQQAVWASEFDQWWESEGQYHRAGGNEYCRTFAWWAWLNREQSKIEQLERERQQALQQLKGFQRLVVEDLICDQSLADLIKSHLKRIEKTLRGECE